MSDKDIEFVLADFRERLIIDQFALEEGCKDQPDLYREVGELYVSFKSSAKRLKEEVEYVKAELQQKIRSNPDVYGLAKVTESAISAAILLQPEFKEIQKEYLEMDELASTLNIFLTSVEQRKSALKDMVSLYIYNYYSDVSLTSEGKEVVKADEERLRQARRDKASRKKEENLNDNS